MWLAGPGCGLRADGRAAAAVLGHHTGNVVSCVTRVVSENGRVHSLMCCASLPFLR